MQLIVGSESAPPKKAPKNGGVEGCYVARPWSGRVSSQVQVLRLLTVRLVDSSATGSVVSFDYY